MKTWVILHNTVNGIYILVDKESLNYNKEFHVNDILIQELDEGLSYEDARKYYITFLDLIFPVLT